MKDLQAIRGARLLQQWIAEGEHQKQDFKYAISDARKIARSISAFANREGGRLLIGVKDNGVVAGVRNEEDIYVVEQAAERYCRPAQQIAFHAYRIDNLHVIVAEISAAGQLPVYAIEPDGSPRAYYRVDDQNIAAHPLMVRAWERRYSGRSNAYSMTGPHTAVLDYIAAHGAVDDVRRIALDLHISVAAAEDTIVHLAAMNLVEFAYVGSHFAIRLLNKY